MDDLLIEQDLVIGSIKRFEENLKKRKREEITLGTLDAPSQHLRTLWNRCVNLDKQINIVAKDSDKSLIEYFFTKVFEKAEELYLKILDRIGDLLTERRGSASSNTSNASSDYSQIVKLPRIDIPKFTGDYMEWQNFRDLFKSLILSNNDLRDSQKLHYLKLSLDGSAAQVIKHLNITEPNFSSAWEILNKRYENKRLIINSYLNTLISLPSVQNDSIAEFRNLRDTTAEVVRALKNLERNIDNDLLVFITVKKLSKFSLIEWEKTLGDSNEFPSYDELDAFLGLRIRTLEAIQFAKDRGGSYLRGSNTSKVNNKRHSSSESVSLFNLNSSSNSCPLCGNQHILCRCEEFKSLSILNRMELVKKRRLCFNCLRLGHVSKNCTSKNDCMHCKRRHHTLLHLNNDKQKNVINYKGSNVMQVDKPSCSSKLPNVNNENPSHLNAANVEKKALLQFACGQSTMLPTAKVLIWGRNGQEMVVRALLDQGSEVSFISNRLVQYLQIRKIPDMTRIETIDNVYIGTAKSRVEIAISPARNSKTIVQMSALVLPRLKGYVPPSYIPIYQWEHLQGLKLADPQPFSDDEVQLIIGSDYFGSLLLGGVRKGPSDSLVAQETLLGWILSGPIKDTNIKLNKTVVHHHCVQLPDLQKELTRFWELEELPKQKLLSEEEQNCEDYFCKTHSRNSEGRYVVRLPVKENSSSLLGASLNTAIAVIQQTECRLAKNLNLRNEYYKFLNEYEELNHMREISSSDALINEHINPIYLPYHPVIKENSSTTPVRLVFNASSKTSTGFSLNNLLMVGPKLHNDIISILIRWRMHKFVLTADICKMFRQILVDEKDVDYQRIVSLHKNGEIKHYQLLTLTYGMACAPYLSNRVLKQLMEDEGSVFPEAKTVLDEDFFVDDALFGADSLDAALKLKSDLILLLEKGGFPLRKFKANDIRLLDSEVDDIGEDLICFDQKEISNGAVLGLIWHSGSDKFHLSVQLKQFTKWTKRIVLSVISQIYDPMGWISPVIVITKILMQELWLRKVEWDEELPQDLLEQWHSYLLDISQTKDVTIPRWTNKGLESTIEIHGFADASIKAYAAVVYLRVINPNAEPIVSIIISKTKVAPLKTVSVPRLELCALVLLARLINKVQTDMKCDKVNTYAWTDSAIALAWITKPPSTWRTFVANRVSEVQSIVPQVKWRHVPSAENPADCASRGLSLEQLKKHPLWWNGPKWLNESDVAWPKIISFKSVEKCELRKNDSVILANLHNQIESKLHQLCHSISSWLRLLRITAFCLRFISLCQKKKSLAPSKFLNSFEISNAKKFWCKFVQTQCFSDEIRDLNSKGSINNCSSIKTLSPFLDGDGLLRITGRLNEAPISWNAKHPIILPRHQVSVLIVEHVHLKALHGGTQLTLHLLRQEFWILGARNLVRKVVHNCVVCARQRIAGTSQLMGHLPIPRVHQYRAFLHTGLDYAGPIQVKLGKGRGHHIQKAYLALFICMSTKAVHLELVSDYTTDAFLSAFKRFVSRRGLPSDLYSDNGTTFQGADKELRQSFQTLMKDERIRVFLAHDKINWHFIPPYSPHFGGLWEAGIKSVKHHLRRMTGAQKLNIEEFTTLLSQIEACLNSRPLGPLSNDSEDLNYLTPGHFLVGAPLIAVPECSLLDSKENRLTRWQVIQRLTQQFWKRWSVEYQHTLQQRLKWSQRKNNVKIGDIVLLQDASIPRSKWRLGRIIECHPGKDGLVRVVTLKTQDGIYKKPIAKVCCLPIIQD